MRAKYQVDRYFLSRYEPGKAGKHPWNGRTRVGCWSRLHRLHGSRRSPCMTDTTAHHDPVPTRLWGLDDLAAYIGCSDARPTTRLPGFPPELLLPGVRGPRWHGPSVTEFFASLSVGNSEPAAASPEPEPLRLPRVSAETLSARLAVTR